MFSKDKKKQAGYRSLFIAMLVFGIVGLIVSFVLSVEEFRLLQNPDVVLGCSLNAVMNCTEVMKTWQAAVFGFPNMFIGLMAFPVVITTAIVALAGAKLPRGYWIGMMIGYGLGAIFAYWLFFNSVYVIQILCPWCLVITFTTTILLDLAVRYNLRENTLRLNKKTNAKVQSFLDRDLDKLLVAIWLVILALAVFLKFGADLYA